MLFTIKDCTKVFRHYRLGKVKKMQRSMNGYSNVAYKVTTSQGDFFLKIYLNKKEEHILYELRLLETLKLKGFPTISPIPDIFGNNVHPTPFGEVVIFDFLYGEEPQINAKTASVMGQVLAHLNAFDEWEDFERKYILNFDIWRQLIVRFGYAENQYPEFFQYFEKETTFLSPAMEVSLPIGLIHGDPFPDNTIFQDGNLIALLDFEYAGTDYLLFDIDLGINGFCFRNNLLDKDLLSSFLEAYHKTRKIHDSETELLGYYIQATAHIMVGWHLDRIMKNRDRKSYNRVNYLIQRIKNLRKTQAATEHLIGKIVTQTFNPKGLRVL